MPRINTSLFVHQPPTAVFKILTNFTKYPMWVVGVSRGWTESPGQVRVGTVFKQAMRTFGKSEEASAEVTEYVPFRIFAYGYTAGVWKGSTFRYELSNSEGGTLVDFKSDVRLSGLPGIITTFNRRGLRRLIIENVESLDSGMLYET